MSADNPTLSGMVARILAEPCDCPLCQHGGGDAPMPTPEDTLDAMRAWYSEVARCVHGSLDCVSCDWTDGRAAGTLRA